MKETVILVPGIMGSVLMDGDKTVWPGSPLELVLPFKHIDALLKPDLVATDVIRKVSISKQYDHLLDSLKECGFEEGNSGTLKVFPYDWRKDNARAAQNLADYIDNLVTASEIDLSITLLAHSMGGLISRCYLESGLYNNRLGFSKIKCLITMGTPHRGAPMALAAVLGKEKRLFLSAEQVQRVANDPNFPSLYQLLPPKNEPFAWDRDMEARLIPKNIYNHEISIPMGLSSINLESAKNFHEMLNLEKRPANVRYFFFAGTRQTTTSSIQISRNELGYSILKDDRDDAGDGTVPFWSSSQSGIQTEPVGGEHGGIYKNAGLRKTLGTLLGKAGMLLATGIVPEISLRNNVVNPEDQLQITIDFPKATKEVHGEVRLRRIVDSMGLITPDASWSESFPISYNGPDIDHLSIVFNSPQNLGVYEVSYFSPLYVNSNVSTELFIQEP